MKNVMKLMLKCLCVMMPLLFIWIYTWKNPLAYVDEEAPYYLWNKQKTNTMQDKYYNTVILGDSIANAAYIPEILSDSTVNLSLGGTTPVENYYVLKEWLKYHQAPVVCYISFLDMHFQGVSGYWPRTVYTHRFPAAVDWEIIKAAVRYGEDSIAVKDYLMEFFAYRLCLPHRYITALLNAGFNQRGGRYIARGNYEYSSSETIAYSEFSVGPMFDAYYKKLIRLCVENDMKVNIVKLPLPDNVIFTDSYQAGFHDYYDRLKEEFPQVTVDWIPVYEQKEFADAAHMNSHGALRFSRALKKRHPKDFLNVQNAVKQVDGLNDSIQNENLPGPLMGWIEGKDYTVIVNDGTGIFASVCRNEAKRNGYQIDQTDVIQKQDGSTMLFASGIHR